MTHDLEPEIPDADYIVKYLVVEWQRQFLKKNADYGPDPDSLGPKAIFVDIWRKARKLRRALWDGQPLTYEQPREIMMDMIGHLFLMVAQTDKANGGNIRPPRPGQKVMEFTDALNTGE
jgi:hypothetical protein